MPTTGRCVFDEADEGLGIRQCRNPGYGEPPLCRSHARYRAEVIAALEAEEDAPANPLIDAVLDHPRIQPLFDKAGSLIDRFASILAAAPFAASAAQPPPQPPPRHARRPAPPPPPPREDPRQVLLFDPDEVLTEQLIRERRKRLAAVIHPDGRGGAGDKAMARINAAADALFQALKKSPPRR